MKTYQKDQSYRLLPVTNIYYTEVANNLFYVRKGRNSTVGHGRYVVVQDVAETLNSKLKVVVERMDGTLFSNFKLTEEVRGYEL